MEEYIGMIRMFAGPFAPRNWAFCNGQTLPIAGNASLHSLIGTTYGGDKLTFNLPDLRGAIPVGACRSTFVSSELTPKKLGEVGGELSHTLVNAEMATHRHPFNVSNLQASLHLATAGSSIAAPNRVSGRSSVELLGFANADYRLANMSPSTIGHTGSGYAHNNMMPTTFINYIICLEGLYPVQG